MALEVYFKEDIVNILRGHLVARPDWRECLEAVALSIGSHLEVTQGVHIIDSRDHTRQLILGSGSGNETPNST